jgi:phospholipid N-methyltransferase
MSIPSTTKLLTNAFLVQNRNLSLNTEFAKNVLRVLLCIIQQLKLVPYALKVQNIILFSTLAKLRANKGSTLIPNYQLASHFVKQDLHTIKHLEYVSRNAQLMKFSTLR